MAISTSTSNLTERNFGTFQKEPHITTVYIGNLKYTKTEKSLLKLFSRFGRVSYIKLVVDKKTGRSTGIAFVQMPNREEAKEAIKSLNGYVYEGRTLKVSVAKENPGINPRALSRKLSTKSENSLYKDSSKSEGQNQGAEKVRKPKRKKESGLDRLFNYLDKK